MSVSICTHMCRFPQWPEESIESPSAGVTGGGELPHTGAGNHTPPVLSTAARAALSNCPSPSVANL